jgi:hypothetical protein
MRTTALVLTLFLCFPVAADAPACPAGKRALLILGSFHMQSSGEDSVNRNDDVSSPARQAEIADLVEKLARYQPTKVAVESARNSTVWNDRYRQWLDGTRPLGMNEIEQIGFRLVKRLALSGLTPVDYPMWMSGLTPIERHEPKQTGKAKEVAPSEPDPLLEEVKAEVARHVAHLASHTVAQHLAYLNEPRRAAMSHRWDVLSNIRPGDGVSLYEKSDLASNWYKRNLRIFTNVLDASAPGDRILLIIGSSHTKILSDWAADHPDVCLVPAARYLE